MIETRVHGTLVSQNNLDQRQAFDQLLAQAIATKEIQNGAERAYLPMERLEAGARASAEQIWQAASEEASRTRDLTAQEKSLRSRLEELEAPTGWGNAVSWLGRAWLPTSSLAILLLVLALLAPLVIKAVWWTRILIWPGVGLAIAAAGMTAVHFLSRTRTIRLDENDPRLVTLTSEREAAEIAVRQALLEKGILPFLRAYLNDQTQRSYGRILTIEGAPGLSELFDPAYEIPTDATDRLKRLMEQLPGGSIGISGPRGSGKTTLIRSFVTGRYSAPDDESLAVLVAAPVEYAPREFVLHLFATLCRTVLGRRGRVPEFDVPRPELDAARIQYGSRIALGAAGVLLSVGAAIILAWSLITRPTYQVQSILLGIGAISAGLIVGTLGLLLQLRWRRFSIERARFEAAFSSEGPPTSWASRVWASLAYPVMLAAGAGSVAAGMSLIVMSQFNGTADRRIAWPIGVIFAGVVLSSTVLTRPNLGRYERYRRRENGSGLQVVASRRLQEILFQQSLSYGWSSTLKFPGAMNLPIGFEAGRTHGLNLAALPLTFPEIVTSFREFVQQAGAQRRRILIGIDELDKIESAEKARQFLNDIKAIFGLKGCYFLVSVSEDAMASFERRGMPFRDVFDSSFDEIIKVRYLDLEHAKRLLFRRIIGLPMPFVDLCHCLSGGLARDLIRAARNLIDLGQRFERLQLHEACQKLVEIEVVAKTEAIIAAVRSVDLEPEASEVIGWCERLGATELSGANLVAHCRGIGAPGMMASRGSASADRQTILRLTRELVSFYYYCATLVEFFGPALDEALLRRAESPEALAGSLDRLAASRQAFAINPTLAWTMLSAFRTAWKLESLEFPAAALA